MNEYPNIIASSIKIPMMRKASLRWLLFLNRYSGPSPAFMTKPLSKAPNGKAPAIYRLERRTLEAQLGIIPINIAARGEKYLLLDKKELMSSSPTPRINNPNKKEMTYV